MSRTRFRVQMVVAFLLGSVVIWEAAHDKSVLWISILGGLAILNILSAYISFTFTRKGGDK